jgi:3'-phosphoadenosine 5'-phosphosulfate sulfotransferase (PAPS reductase)/FAD synthetase
MQSIDTQEPDWLATFFDGYLASSPDFVISVSYGNDSVAMIQWAYEHNYAFFNTWVVYCDTGWAAPGWERRVDLGERFAQGLGFKTARLSSMGMEELVRMHKGWPGNGQQFCTAHLKGVPFLMWLDEADKQFSSTVLVGKRRDESDARKETPEYVEASEYHGGRRLHHPLYLHTEADRDALLARAGIVPLPPHLVGQGFDKHDKLYLLPHRSMECSPCVNANRGDVLMLSPAEMARVNRIEVEVGKPMFRPKRFNGVGIYGVVMWARHGKNHSADPLDQPKYSREDTKSEPASGCAAEFGCGL